VRNDARSRVSRNEFAHLRLGELLAGKGLESEKQRAKESMKRRTRRKKGEK